jgi:predicted adenine nucleotide alpha hydrolase (AANH) superfamily ATPase
VDFEEAPYDHEKWLEAVRGLEDEPERGRRCLQCFRYRLLRSAERARELGIETFTTSLASSRWKNLDQINQAGLIAEQAVEGVKFWAQNWRKGGLYERRNQLLKEYRFYNQQYCGCEFSMRDKSTESTEK